MTEYEVSPEATIASARDALTKLKATERDATGWRENPIYWVGRLATALEHTLKAIDQTEGDKAQETNVSEAAEYGIFEDGACIEAGFHGESGNAQAERAATGLVADNPEMAGAYEVLEICPDHDEQPRHTCEDCASDN
ncbi:hypothetical protein [Streptomyces sp. NPDC051994]|uniref:hypothetical protein n=1 Tax=unclassified Streptomyces TaxID=2593676 RepID=UPI00342F6666